MEGSAVFSGQPGIGEHYYWYLTVTSINELGKTCILYSILILCIILARPIVSQDVRGKVYIIGDAVRPLGT